MVWGNEVRVQKGVWVQDEDRGEDRTQKSGRGSLTFTLPGGGRVRNALGCCFFACETKRRLISWASGPGGRGGLSRPTCPSAVTATPVSATWQHWPGEPCMHTHGGTLSPHSQLCPVLPPSHATPRDVWIPAGITWTHTHTHILWQPSDYSPTHVPGHVTQPYYCHEQSHSSPGSYTLPIKKSHCHKQSHKHPFSPSHPANQRDLHTDPHMVATPSHSHTPGGPVPPQQTHTSSSTGPCVVVPSDAEHSHTVLFSAHPSRQARTASPRDTTPGCPT